MSFQNLPSHPDDGVGGRDLFRAGFDAPEDGVAAPNSPMMIDGLKDILAPPVSWIEQKAEGLGQDGRP